MIIIFISDIDFITFLHTGIPLSLYILMIGVAVVYVQALVIQTVITFVMLLFIPIFQMTFIRTAFFQHLSRPHL